MSQSHYLELRAIPQPELTQSQVLSHLMQALHQYLPAYAGLLIEKELSVMGKALEDPKRPFVAILGGAKVSDKIGVINNLLEKADTIIIGGGMAYTFIKAQGGEIGTSLLEADKMDYALEMIQKAKDRGVAVGPARGSAAASLCCYLWRITEVNPMAYPSMLFERFIAPDRNDEPDIDLDFEDERRDEVRQMLEADGE